MKNSIILLVIGIIITIIPIVTSLIVNDKRHCDNVTYNKKEFNYDEKINFKIESEIILERVKKLESEVSQLKHENNILIQERKKQNTLLNNNSINDNSFKPILNYSVFKEKNSSIIELYKRGSSKEDIAKTLNKSIREIEMVIRLIK